MPIFAPKFKDMAYAYKAFLFDFDGVVVDTEDQYTKFWDGMNRRYVPQVRNFAQILKGNTLVEVFRKYIPLESDRQTIRRELGEFQLSMSYASIPGVEAFVAALSAAGVKTAVVTSSDRAKMEAVYRQRPEIRGMFSRVFTSEDYRESKPSPDCYVSAARSFGLEPRECIVAEDSVNGLRAAKASGSLVVGLATTNPRSLVEEYSDVVIDDFSAFTPEDADRAYRARFGAWRGRGMPAL